MSETIVTTTFVHNIVECRQLARSTEKITFNPARKLSNIRQFLQFQASIKSENTMLVNFQQSQVLQKFIEATYYGPGRNQLLSLLPPMPTIPQMLLVQPTSQYFPANAFSNNRMLRPAIPPPLISQLNREVWFVRYLAQNSDYCNIIPMNTGVLVDGKYEVLQQIGSGAYGNVYKAREVKFSRLCALKVIKTKLTLNKRVLREVHVLSQIAKLNTSHHNFIVRLFRAFKFHEHLFLVYELLGPSLESVLNLNRRSAFPFNQAKEIACQVISAVQFLHTHGIVHHDIKPENIVFSNPAFHIDGKTGLKIMQKNDVRLIDFGSSLHISDNKNCDVPTTRQYRSPEMGVGYPWSFSSDIWSVGCTMFELVTGRLLFPCESEVQKCYMLEYMFCQRIPQRMGKVCQLDCFDKDGRLRYDFAFRQLYPTNHVIPFQAMQLYFGRIGMELSQFFDLLEKMLRLEPNERITLDKVFEHQFWKFIT